MLVYNLKPMKFFINLLLVLSFVTHSYAQKVIQD